ncbi:MAG: apolipoprotein N-acyltransferase [Bacteroidia bacterium]
MLQKINPWIYVLLSSILLFAAWPPLPFPFLIFLAFIPLLALENHHYQVADKPLQYYFQISLTFILWNAATTYWTWFASPAGAVVAILLNAQLQTLPWLLFHRTRKIFGDKLAYPALVMFSLSVEYLHLNWDIAWPWLNIGNVFAGSVWAVQWYEITGTQGGSLWVYVVTILVYITLKAEWGWKSWIRPALWFLFPLVLSFYMSNWEKQVVYKDSLETIVVQPNIDPYTDKFDGMSPEQQLQRLFRLSDSLVTPATRLMFWPETALTDFLDEGSLDQEPTVQRIQAWVNRYPDLMLISGASTIRFYGENETHSSTSREVKQAPGIYYDSYNTALAFRANESVNIYHKSKLVPGVEKMPYPRIFGFLEAYAIDLGGTSGSLGRSDSAVVFKYEDIRVAPIICYESVFGEYVGEYVNNGAGILGIITNDGWWKDTPGYRQHFLYARLRAIENRMYVARSANTGISGFIDPSGKVLAQSEWWVEDALKMNISMGTGATFYARSGDYLGRLAGFFSVLVLIAGFVRRKTRKGY